MSETYQAIFDAVRSKITDGDLASATERALRDMNIGHYIEMAGHAVQQAAVCIEERLTSPSAIYRPSLSIDGNQWCALYGDDLQCGVAGFGDTPEQAMTDFDKHWRTPLHNSPSYVSTAASQAASVPDGEPEWPEYHHVAMGCGLEDRGITDRYEAMQHGWDDAVERCAEAFNNWLAAAPQAQEEE